MRWKLGADKVQTLDRGHHVRTALAAGQGVDLVEDDGLEAAEKLAALLAREHEIQDSRAW